MTRTCPDFPPNFCKRHPTKIYCAVRIAGEPADAAALTLSVMAAAQAQTAHVAHHHTHATQRRRLRLGCGALVLSADATPATSLCAG